MKASGLCRRRRSAGVLAALPMESLSAAQIEKYLEMAVGLGMEYLPKVLLALVTLVVGLWVIGGITKLLRRTMEARQVDPTLVPFLSNLTNWIMKAALVISVVSILGIETTSFVAVLGAAGLAVGLALQGSLQNFAGGVLLLIFRPYKVGDLIEAQDKLGEVLEIQIFTTVLLSPENRRIILPNGAVSNGTITNLSAEGHVRVDCTVGVAYDADLKKSKEVLTEMVRANPKVLADPAPIIAVSELGDSSVNLAVRPYAKPEDYWDVFFEVTEGCKLALDAAGISIPFPQRDVHLFEHKS